MLQMELLTLEDLLCETHSIEATLEAIRLLLLAVSIFVFFPLYFSFTRVAVCMKSSISYLYVASTYAYHPREETSLV